MLKVELYKTEIFKHGSDKVEKHMKLIDGSMIDIKRICFNCEHLQRNEKRELKCGLTNNPVQFEASCNLFQINKIIQAKQYLEKLEDSNKFNNASIGKRMGNYFIDTIVIIVLESLLGMFVIKFYGIESGIYSMLFKNYFGNYILLFLLSIIYYSIFESISGKTIGKYFTKTKVLTLKDEKPDFLRVLLRSVCRFVPLDQISFILNNKSGWHDTLSKTLVIEE